MVDRSRLPFPDRRGGAAGPFEKSDKGRHEILISGFPGGRDQG